jgi:ABC-type transport system substrate-binding protein
LRVASAVIVPRRPLPGLARRATKIVCALGLALAPLSAPAGAAPEAIVLTGTAFPAGFGAGVAADPVGLQAALWTPLVGFDDHLRPYAGLAARVPTLANGDVRVVGGGMTVTVHLRPGLRFSDGSPLTADDVVFGLRINRDSAIGNSFGLDEIARISAPDPRTVVLQFGDLYGAYLAYAMPPALPRAYFERKYGTTDIHGLALAYLHDSYSSPRDVFSGPYRIGEVAQGQRVTLEPNPYFTALPAPATRPELRYVVLSEDESALTRALHARQAGIDLALGFGPASLPLLQGLPKGLRVRVTPSLAVEHLELNMAVVALRDLRVRQALQDAIDKGALARAVFPASSHPDRLVATSLIPSASPYHEALPASRVDRAGAERLLAAAGYVPRLTGPGRHLTLTLSTPDDPTRRREADLLVHDWAAIGVRVIPHLTSASPADRGGFYAPYALGGVLATRGFDLALFDLRMGPDPATVAALFDPDRVPTPLSQGIWRRNYTGIDVEALAQLPETAQASFDPASRRQGYYRLQGRVNALLPYIVLYERPQILVDDGRIGGLAPAPQDSADLWNAWEWTRRQP